MQELLRNNFDISKLIDMDTYGSFIPYNDRQILTICDGLLEGFDLYYFKNINLEFYQMREVIEGLKVNRDDNTPNLLRLRLIFTVSGVCRTSRRTRVMFFLTK